ncbi:serine O-acetyltransferase [Clostridium perfringens]
MRILSYILWKLSQLLLGCSLPPSADLKDGVSVAHPIGIVIHQNAIIGKNTYICQNVTIGRQGKDLEESPVIGENCFIGAGACVLGNILIGDNVRIGANAVVLRDIPSNSIAVGIPAKIIRSGENCNE